mmetsp:Transcript_52424/g.102595  ORF Transcript_52424/g.102595 Transcript_52424/m.102595 type:complete len:264 (+) Transcript_52424:251-1042(+)
MFSLRGHSNTHSFVLQISSLHFQLVFAFLSRHVLYLHPCKLFSLSLFFFSDFPRGSHRTPKKPQLPPPPLPHCHLLFETYTQGLIRTFHKCVFSTSPAPLQKPSAVPRDPSRIPLRPFGEETSSASESVSASPSRMPSEAAETPADAWQRRLSPTQWAQQGRPHLCLSAWAPSNSRRQLHRGLGRLHGTRSPHTAQKSPQAQGGRSFAPPSCLGDRKAPCPQSPSLVSCTGSLARRAPCSPPEVAASALLPKGQDLTCFYRNN